MWVELMEKGVALMGHRIGSIYIHIVTDHFALTHNKVDLNFSRGHYDQSPKKRNEQLQTRPLYQLNLIPQPLHLEEDILEDLNR